ncbi:phage tail protein [Streptomyces cyaneochromogenes]|uniref:Phage tail protein n=1 Tax=Streptomyces cyaneochromogenes TaxID=2496836 RepID=A0A3Q9EUA1_9ACTN|nr:phage tail protein [Streptomyces cyaneochromogenes]AZQ35935.1 phage tail protein [Streptomyces cyaneochromogenes]
MSFLVASGHVDVTANTREAKDELERFIDKLKRVGPEAARAFDRADRQAAKLEGTLGRIKALGNIRLRADLEDRAGAGIAAMRDSIRDLQRQSPVQLRARFSGDTAQLVAMAQAMRDLRDDTSRTSTPLTGLATRSAAAAAALQLLDNAAGDASRSLRTLRGRVAATADAMRDLRDTTARAGTAMNAFANRAQTADGRLNTLSGNTRTLRGDLDDLDGSLRRVGGSMGALRPSLGGLGSGGGGGGGGLEKLTQAALLLSPALIPVAASLTAIAAKAAAAGAGVAAFAVAAAGQIKDLAEASQAQTKYNEAVEQYGRGSAEAAKAALEQQRALARMPAATQQAAASLSVLKDEYNAWSDALAADTMPVVTKSLGLFQAMLPQLTPTVRGVSAELQHLMDVAAGGMQTPGFDQFMNKLAGWSAGAIADATRGLVKFSQALDGGEVGSDMQEFMDYVRANGPLVADTFGNLAKAAAHLLVAASDVGVGILDVANAFAKLVASIPTSVLSTMLELYAALKLVSLGVAGVNAVVTSSAIARLGAYFTLMRTAGVGPTLSATAASMTRVQKASVGLGVLGVAAFAINELAEASRGAPPDLDKLNTALKTLATTGKFTGELKATFGDMDGFVAKLGKLKTESAALEKAKPFTAFSGLGAFTDTAITKLDDLVRGAESVGATKDDFKAVDQQLAAMATNGYANQAAEHFRNFKAAALAGGMSLKEFNAAFPGYRAAAAGLKAEADLAAAGMGAFGQQAMATKAKLDAQKSAADGLRASLIALNDTNRSAYDAQLAFEQGIDDLTASFKENGATLDEHTEAGRRNGEAMSNVSKRHDEMIVSALAAGDSMASMKSESEGLRATMMELATKGFKGNTKAATEYVNRLLGTPESVETSIRLERQAAITGLQEVQAAIKKTPNAKSVKVDTLNAAAIKALEAVGLKTKQLPDGRTEVFTANGQSLGDIAAVAKALNNLNGKTANTYTNHNITYHYRSDGASFLGPSGRYASGGRVRGYASGGDVQAFPSGGYVDGPGTSTSDSILAMMGSGAAAMVSNTEYVVRAAAVAKYGVGFLDALNAGRLRLAGFAKGGKVSKAEKDARKSATPDLTISHFGKMAGYKTTEFAGDMARPDSLNDLVGTLNNWRNQIKKATHGSAETKLLKQLDGAGKALLANEKKLAGVNKALESAKGKLDDLKGKFDQLKTSVSSSLVSFGNITKIGEYGTSPETLIKQLSMDAGRTTEFAKQLEALKAKGLNATAIADIAGAGITGGGMATAQSLLTATPEQIKHINELQKQLETSANKAGTTTADAMYGAGIKAAEGLVKGLTAQQKAIEAAMMAIAKGMEKSLKAALGIKSPAKLMEPIGEFSAMGVEAGWTKRLAKGDTLLSGNTAGLRVRPALMPGASGGAATATMAPVVNLTVNVSSNDLLTSSAKRKAFADLLAKETNDALLTYQKGRRR